VNVIGNAVKFTTRGSVAVELEADPRSIAVHVHDTGPGIPAERLDDIFDPFTQVDGSSTRQAAGAGLGLTIARRLARLLGGDIRVARTTAQGSTFTITLPRTAVAAGNS
jgi:signal transduction histidine kinase